jgi:hypothetical protein
LVIEARGGSILLQAQRQGVEVGHAGLGGALSQLGRSTLLRRNALDEVA